MMLKALRALRKLHLDGLLLRRGAAHSFTDYFKGFEKVESVKRIFGERTEEVLRSLKVEFTWVSGYMWVNASTGHLMISSQYLKDGDKTDIYLDIIHELVHVRQHIDGRQLFDERYNYADRPTEIEAYRVTVEEARSLGLSDQRICGYLRTEWMKEEDFRRLAKTLGVSC